MKGLLLNDYYCIKGWKWLLPVLAVFPAFAALIIKLDDGSGRPAGLYEGVLKAGFGVAFFIGLGALFAVLKADETANWMKQSFVTSVSRKTYMAEKYVIALILTAVPSAVSFVLSAIALAVVGSLDADALLMLLASFGTAILSMAAMCAWALPVGLRFGLKKLTAVFYAFFIIGLTVGVFETKYNENGVFEIVKTSVFVIDKASAVILFIIGWRWIEQKEV